MYLSVQPHGYTNRLVNVLNKCKYFPTASKLIFFAFGSLGRGVHDKLIGEPEASRGRPAISREACATGPQMYWAGHTVEQRH